MDILLIAGCPQHDMKVGDKIRAATAGKLKNVFDTVNVESSAAICANAIAPIGGVYCNLLGLDCPRQDVKSTFFLGYGISGESYIFEGDKYEARPEDFVFASGFLELAEKLWTEGKFKPHPQRIGTGGLLGAVCGMQEMREGRISGEKLVYLVEETRWP